MMKHHKSHNGLYSTDKVWSFIKTRKKLTNALISWAVTDGIQIFLWPVFLFLILGGYLIFGLIGSLAMVANSIAIFASGKMYDKKPYKKFFVASSLGVSVTWMTRFLSLTPFGVGLSDVVNRLVSPPWWMKIKRIAFYHGEKVDSLVFASALEYLTTIGYFVGLLLGYILLVYSQGYWAWLILPTVLGTIIATLYTKDE